MTCHKARYLDPFYSWIYFINANIGVLSGRFLSMEVVIKTFILLVEAFVGQIAWPLHRRLCIFTGGVMPIPYQLSSPLHFARSWTRTWCTRKNAKINERFPSAYQVAFFVLTHSMLQVNTLTRSVRWFFTVSWSTGADCHSFVSIFQYF